MQCAKLALQVQMLAEKLDRALQKVNDWERNRQFSKIFRSRTKCTVVPTYLQLQNECSLVKKTFTNCSHKPSTLLINRPPNSNQLICPLCIETGVPVRTKISPPPQNGLTMVKVIHEIKKPVTKDEDIRKAVWVSDSDALIERITRYGERTPKYKNKEDLLDKLLENWVDSRFDSLKARTPVQWSESQSPNCFAKHAPI